MKRSLPLMLGIALCLLLAACAKNAAAPTGEFSKDDLGLEVSGSVYYIREDCAPLLGALGEEHQYSEIVSCVYDGKDKTYEYAGVTIGTVPVDGKDVIEVITLTDGSYATLRGAKVGDKLSAVKALYGDGWFDDGYLTYSLSGDEADIHAERIQFEYAGDTVTRIFLYSPSY